MLIKDLFNFEDIQQVIAIGNIENEREMVEKFVISTNLKEDLLELIEYLKGNKQDKNTSVDIIGNYGTGKSHLLTFLSLILSNPKMIEYIQDDELKNEFKSINREFLVVKYELPGQDKSFEDIFFYRVRKQLKENYGIGIRKIDSKTEEKDPKELVEEILLKIKEKYPNKGLIVIFDEYSDFLKSKESSKQNRDLNFTRQLAECSKNQDFILMLSMQEYIFTNPEYKDKADLINKIEKRFLKFNITSENIEDIIAKRMVTKTPNQIQELKNQFNLLKDKFPNIALEEERYINLFPVHPYLIEMLSRLTLFENRSILMFISDQTKKIRENEFPTFITYNLIYNELIESDNTKKNNEMVKPVIDIVQSLRDIIPRLDSKYQDRAKILIDALAIKNLVTPPDNNGEKKGGDTPEKFAENLCILPNSKIIEPADDIRTILEMLIDNSEGQFISKNSKNNIYYINLDKNTDYERIINNKARNMDDIGHNNEVFVEEFLLRQMGIEVTNDLKYADNNKKYILDDTVKWNQRNSFREGTLIIDIGNRLNIDDSKDYSLKIKGFGPNIIHETNKHQIIIEPDYSDEFKQSIRRLAAVKEFLKTKTYVQVMNSKKQAIIDNEVQKLFKKALIGSSIYYDSQKFSLDDLGITTDIISEIIANIKQQLLDEYLTNRYSKYPKFKSDAVISKNNIEGTFEVVIHELSLKTKLSDFEKKSRRILIPLGLLKNDDLDINNSQYTSIILEKVESTQKNIDIKEIVDEFEKEPYGFQKEITYLLLAILLRNGNIMISNKNGQYFSSSDFKNLFKSGIKIFEDLRYIKQEEGPGADTEKLFDILDLDKSLLQNKKDHVNAYKSYTEKYESILSDISHIQRDFENILQSNVIKLPLHYFKENIDLINRASFEKIEVTSIGGFNKLDYSEENLNNIKKGYELISVFKSFFKDYDNYLYSGFKYMKEVIELIDNDIFKENKTMELKNIYKESLDILNDSRKLLKYDERKPLEGKIQLFKNKYKSMYYNAHESYVGKNIKWNDLEDIQKSEDYQKLNYLSKIKSINKSKFTQIQSDMLNIKDYKCYMFNVNDLEFNARCSCGFPQILNSYVNINSKIDEIEKSIPILLISWEKEILITINDNKSKIEQLDSEQQEIINTILKINKLEQIDFNVINAINSLLDDIEIKEISLEELFNDLTSERGTLKVDEIIDKFEDYIKNVVSDSDNARIKLIKK